MPSQPDRGPIAEIALKEVNLGVNRLWHHFDEITRIPRKTRNEQAMREHVLAWAEEYQFTPEVDPRGNVLVTIPATPNLETAPGVILQGHLDMVCVGEPDPAVVGVTPVLSPNGEWLQANNTTLGADNGIGVSTCMSIAESQIEHGPLALMLTVNEEVGIEGALAMDFKTPLDNFKFLLNLDSEEEGEATISSAGGGDTLIRLPIETEPIQNRQLLTLSLEGLMGGHSGLEIGENRLNAIKVAALVLDTLTTKTNGLRLVDLNLGYARNVIPSKGEITIAVRPEEAAGITNLVAEAREKVLAKSKHPEEQALKIRVTESDKRPEKIMSLDATVRITRLLSDLPHGVASWSESVPGLVQTSTNLAKVNTENNLLILEMMTRSSVDAELSATRRTIQQTASQLGAQVTQTPTYPGWPARPESIINKITAKEWQAISGKELKIIAVHAGLECGAIMGKYPFLEAISIGPEIKGAHSSEERVNIASVGKFYRLVENLVKAIAKL